MVSGRYRISVHQKSIGNTPCVDGFVFHLPQSVLWSLYPILQHYRKQHINFIFLMRSTSWMHSALNTGAAMLCWARWSGGAIQPMKRFNPQLPLSQRVRRKGGFWRWLWTRICEFALFQNFNHWWGYRDYGPGVGDQNSIGYPPCCTRCQFAPSALTYQISDCWIIQNSQKSNKKFWINSKVSLFWFSLLKVRCLESFKNTKLYLDYQRPPNSLRSHKSHTNAKNYC